MGKYHSTLGFGCEQVKGAGSPAPQVEETAGSFNQSVLKHAELKFLSCKKTCD